jgi:predicted MFS family arabinose efflux permease
LRAIHHRLDALNFFLADVRGGLGAFVSVFLVTAAGWTSAEVGAVLTVSGLIGIVLHTPVGATIDATHAKRALLIGAVVLLAVCAIAIERMPSGPVVFAADVTMAILGGVFAPVVAALTLGLVAEHAFAERLARNAVWDRIGNLTIAAIVGAIGLWWSQRSTFYLIPFFAALSVAVILSIPSRAIDHARARGFAPEQTAVKAQGFWVLLTGNRPLLILALIAATFHFANAAMLPLAGQKLGLAHPGLESALTSACILVAQLVTIPVAMLVGRKADIWGLRPLLAAACIALALRGAAFAWFDSAPLLIGAQILDGVATGIWDVLVPLILADLVAGSGRYSASRGVVSTVQGIGGSLSNAAAGLMVMAGGYPAAFLGLALVALLACGLTLLMPEPEQVKADHLRRLQAGADPDHLDQPVSPANVPRPEPGQS